MHSFDLAQRFELEGGMWGFPLKHQKAPFCGRKLSLEPQSGIVLFGISGTGRKPNPQGFAQSHPSLGQVLIRQGWKAYLSWCGIEQNLED